MALELNIRYLTLLSATTYLETNNNNNFIIKMNCSILCVLLMACVMSGNYAAQIPSVVHNLDQITSQLQNQPSSIHHNLTEDDQVDQHVEDDQLDQHINSFDHLLNELEQVSNNDSVERHRRGWCFWVTVCKRGVCAKYRKCN